MTSLVAALFLAAAIIAPSMGRAATTIGEAGGAPTYVRPDEAMPLAGVELAIPAGIDRESTAQGGLAALVAQMVLNTPVDGAALRDTVAARGGAISYAVTIRNVRFYLEGPPQEIPVLATLVAKALSSPALDAATLDAARAALRTRIGDEENNPVAVGLDAVRGSYYRDAAALPTLGTAASLEQLGITDVRAFYDRWYVRGGAFVTAVGRTGAETDGAAAQLVAALHPGSAPAAAPAGTRPFANQPRRIVTRRNVYAPYVVLGFAAPALGDPDFPAVLVLRSLLNAVFTARAATTLPPERRAIGTIYGYDVAPAQFALWINGAQLDPSAGLAAMNAVLKTAGSKPLSPAVLERYKDMASGEWQLEAMTLEQRAWAIGDAVALGLDPNALDAVPSAIGRVSAADVERVAKQWFARFDVALVLPRGDEGG